MKGHVSCQETDPPLMDSDSEQDLPLQQQQLTLAPTRTPVVTGNDHEHDPPLTPVMDSEGSVQGTDSEPLTLAPTPTPVVTGNGLLGIILYLFLYPIAFKRVQVVGTGTSHIYRRLPRSISFMTYLVLGLAMLGSWYSLRGSESMRRMESGLSADSDRTGHDYAEVLGRLNAIEERMKALVLTQEVDAKARQTFFTTAPGLASVFWNKLLTKLSGGQDITAFIRNLVDSAVSTFSQDILAKPDFALHSGGASVIGSLTSLTLKIRPQGLGSQMMGLIMVLLADHPSLHCIMICIMDIVGLLLMGKDNWEWL
jgi:hypothetical protein